MRDRPLKVKSAQPKLRVTSQIELDVDEVLNGVACWQTKEVEQFADQVMALLARRRAPSLPKNESELLQKINQGLPSEVWKRYEELNAKLHEESITPEEHQELLAIIDRIELADAERMKQLIKLARLRNVSIATLMEQLDIRRPGYA
jgi:hypothetical protein